MERILGITFVHKTSKDRARKIAPVPSLGGDSRMPFDPDHCRPRAQIVSRFSVARLRLKRRAQLFHFFRHVSLLELERFHACVLSDSPPPPPSFFFFFLLFVVFACVFLVCFFFFFFTLGERVICENKQTNKQKKTTKKRKLV